MNGAEVEGCFPFRNREGLIEGPGKLPWTSEAEGVNAGGGSIALGAKRRVGVFTEIGARGLAC